MTEFIGPFQILKSIGKGGMGEVFLAYDPLCKRRVALKQIKKELRSNPLIRKKFLREAKITSQLTHPSIIPIYSIEENGPSIYYTMPFIEGDTFKKLLQQAKKEPSSKTSIYSLTRIFLQICEGIAYSHARGIIHRDLKPENILLGKYGEVLIFDWGIAIFAEKLVSSITEAVPGKVAGTVTHLAPEIALGSPASALSDIYSLGVILYQILTLQLPFHRHSLEEMQKNLSKEKLVSPLDVAPQRDIPHSLLHIVNRCLAFDKTQRYQSVDALIGDIKQYLDGKAEWVLTKELHIEKSEDWAFQENLLLAKQLAITRTTDLATWFSVMLSKEVFLGNIRLEASFTITEENQGLGFILQLPHKGKKTGIDEGYCLWLTSKENKKTEFFKSSVLIKELFLSLTPNTHYHLVIEKTKNELRCFINRSLLFRHFSYLPLLQTQVGILYKDTHFTLENLSVFSASHNVMVSCLAVPDAFLAKKDYDTAYNEYTHISRSFMGRSEGRDALFRSGLALLEKAKSAKHKKELFFEEARNSFEKLHNTEGAPLEYLGKSLIYAATEEFEEEAKCLELALRKFTKHHLLNLLEEHLFYRLHESSLHSREAAYRLCFIGLKFIPHFIETTDTKNLIENLEKTWEKLFFLLIDKEDKKPDDLLLELAFRIGNVHAIEEYLLSLSKENLSSFENGIFALLELGEIETAKKLIDTSTLFSEAIDSPQTVLTYLLNHEDLLLQRKGLRLLFYCIEKLLEQTDLSLLEKAFATLSEYPLAKEESILIDSFAIWYHLLKKEWHKAKALLKKYSLDFLNEENSLIHVYYGIWLYVTEGKEAAINHFSNELDSASPPLYSLFGKFLTGKLDKNLTLFPFEKRELYRELSLFYHCIDNKKKHLFYKKLTNVHVQSRNL